MLFTEPIFFAFFAVVFALHWALPGHRARKLLLLVASYAFYAGWDARFLLLILASTVIDFVIARGMDAAEGAARRRWLLASLTANLGLLGFFKYFNFFIESTNSLFELAGLDLGLRTFGIVLPVGISFYTFQTMSYSIDVYRRQLTPIRDFWDFALFVGFFPQLVMGPILRARTFLPQLFVRTRWSEVPVQSLLALFAVGFIKKACVSDNIAPLVDGVYGELGSYDVLSVCTAVLYYAVQLYCDFSGYTDMAIAVAGLLGYQVALNFDFPLLASNVTDFWRRWHISFSTWLRDYVYFPLGGSRRGPLRTDVNLMLTMLLSGLWHGAGLNFITWGGLNGVALVVHRIYRTRSDPPAPVRALFAASGWAITVWWFAFTLIFFRSQTMAEALEVCESFVLFRAAGDRALSPWTLAWLVPLLAAHLVARRVDLKALAARTPGPLFAAVLGVVTGLALGFVRTDYRPFIYFQF